MPASAKKPPVPQRCISLDATNGGGGGGMGRPSLPKNKKPQLTVEQLRPVHHQSVPNFNHHKNDMGKRLECSEHHWSPFCLNLCFVFLSSCERRIGFKIYNVK